MQPRYSVNDSAHDVTPLCRADSTTLQIDGHQLDVRLQWIDRNRTEIAVNGRRWTVFIAQEGSTLFVHLDGKVWTLRSHDEFGDADEGAAGGGRVTAPMPGVVVQLLVSEGSVVAAGTTVMLIESMKLQTEIKASIAGTVTSLGVAEGSSFDKGAMLLDIEADVTADSGADTAAKEYSRA